MDRKLLFAFFIVVFVCITEIRAQVAEGTSTSGSGFNLGQLGDGFINFANNLPGPLSATVGRLLQAYGHLLNNVGGRLQSILGRIGQALPFHSS